MITDYLKLLRIPNLIFIAIVQLMMHYCITVPILAQFDLEPVMTIFPLSLLIISMVFIAGGANIINDYFDIKIDEINKPMTRIVGKSLTRRQAMIFYQIISGIGLLSGLILCYLASSVTYCFIFAIFFGLGWFVS